MAHRPIRRIRNKTINEKLLDEAIRHAHSVERFKNTTVRDLVRFLNKSLIPDLDRALLSSGTPTTMRGVNQRLTRAQSILKIAEKRLLDLNIGNAKGLARAERNWLINAFRELVPIDHEWQQPSISQLNVLASKAQIFGHTQREWFRNLSNRTFQRIQQEMRLGFANDETIAQLTRRILGTQGALSLTQRGAEAIARTMVNAISSQVRELTFKENDDVIKSVLWVSTLDSRTTPICIDLDGDVFEIGEGIRPPAHPQCRSTVTPVLASFERFGLSDPEPSTRASMNGQVPSTITYPEWLETQSTQVQNEVLGVRRAQAFRDGTPVTNFINRRGVFITLDKLETTGVIPPVPKSTASN